MNERIRELAFQAMSINQKVSDDSFFVEVSKLNEFEKFAELILANADELKRMMNTDPINKPFELNPKFVAKCDEIGRSRRQFQ